MSDDSIFLGIYAKAADTSGHNSRWHVWGNKDGSFLAQQLLPDEKQNGPLQTITADSFFNNFRVSSSAGTKNTDPPGGTSAPESAAKPVERKDPEPKPEARAFVQEKESAGTYYGQKTGGPETSRRADPVADLLPDAAPEVKSGGQSDENAAQKIERKFRSDFSLALIRLGSNKNEAVKMLDLMADHQGPFAENHKFMFSEFGLAMRKRKLFVLAVRFHEKARVLSPSDEHILFNMARVFYDSGKYDKARECLAKAVDMAPEFKPGRDFLAFIDGV